MPLAAGTRLGPYELLGAIGAGGMGEIYRARDPRLGRDVAVKVLPDTISADPDRLRRFSQEARAVAALNHPNILTVHDVGPGDGTPYVVTELLEGETWREPLARRTPTARQVLGFAAQAAQGLAAAHAKRIVHRDFKAANVQVLPDGRVKVMDFGMADAGASPALPATHRQPTRCLDSLVTRGAGSQPSHKKPATRRTRFQVAHALPSCQQVLSRGLCLVDISSSSAESVPGTPWVLVHNGGARWPRTGGLLRSPPLFRFP